MNQQEVKIIGFQANLFRPEWELVLATSTTPNKKWPYGESYSERHTKRSKRLIENGLHPLFQNPIPDVSKKCGKCAHLVRRRERYFKCLKFGETKSLRTDVRMKWPACHLFEEEKK